MPLTPVNIGTAPNNDTGDALRLAFSKLNASDAYLKQYADNLIQGLKWKNKAEVATTANITLSGEQTIDGVVTSASRILVKDQTVKTENGIYLTGAGAWTRTTDADTGDKLVNATVSIANGTANSNTNWTCNASAITLGTTDVTFVEFTGADGVDQGTFDAAIQIINDSLAEKADADHTHTADDITETATKKWTSPTEKNTWNGKETTTGAQSKADAAQTAAEQYADAAVADLEVSVDQNTDDIAGLNLNKANDSEVVKTIETSDGQVLSMDANGKVILPDFSTGGGATIEDQIVDGVTDKGASQNAIFNGLAGKASTTHTHVKADITDFNESDYEGDLGNPVSDGQILSSTIAGVRSWVDAPSGGDSTKFISFALSSPTDDLVAGDTDSFHAPYDFTLNSFFVAVNTAPTGSSLIVDLKKNGTSVTSTSATIDATEETSLTGTNPVISTASFTKGDKITPEIVQVGSIETGKSLKIYLTVTKV